MSDGGEEPPVLVILERRVVEEENRRPKSPCKSKILALVLLELACVGAKDRAACEGCLTRCIQKIELAWQAVRTGKVSTTDIYDVSLGRNGSGLNH